MLPAATNDLLRALDARWPGYVGRITAAAALTIGAIMAGVIWLAWLPVALGFLGIVVLGYWIGASIWVAQQLAGRSNVATAIWQSAGLGPDDTLIYIGLGLRNTAIELSKFLRRGHVLAIDVFNPTLTPNPALGRLRQEAFSHPLLPLNDPRTVWREGMLDRLPLRDGQAAVLVVDQVLCELLQRGDRDRLLREVERVLRPGGRLFVVERVRQPASGWVLGIGGVGRWEPLEAWRTLLGRYDLQWRAAQPLNSLLVLLRADRPIGAPHQLQIPLTF